MNGSLFRFLFIIFKRKICNFFVKTNHRTSSLLVESLTTNNGDGQEKVTQKVNLCCLKLYCAYFILFNSSNVGKFFWSWILRDCIKVQEKKKKVMFSGVSNLDKKSNLALSCCSHATSAKKCTKKAWSHAKLLFC